MPNRTATTVDTKDQDYKLPATVSPLRYQLKLEPNLKTFSFKGKETIDIEVHETISEITLNSADLELAGVFILDNQEQLAGNIALDPDSERVTIKLPRAIQPGKKALILSFSGALTDRLHGFYRSFYKDPEGNRQVLAVTQFEATDARRAFPCWDEPRFKAVFDVSLVIDKNLTAISNASLAGESDCGGGKKELRFNQTMKMSTYLVAFIIGQLEATSPIISGKTPVRIWSVPGKEHLSHFARDCAGATLSFFSHYYGVDYPGDKLDLIAIPDFASGAMENLGAITFRETALLVDEKTASVAELERVADVVAHEIAHMWFGDLVTMEWWNGLWLNEAFATFMEMLAVDNWKPKWQRWDSFAVSRAAAFAVDGLHSTRSIEYPVKHPDEAAAMFDVLTYQKGASVLRMLEQFLGAEDFRKGIHGYLKKHQYANAETADLWDSLQEASNQPVHKMMDSWIFQGGYPLVSVEVDDTGHGITLAQQRFLYNPDDKAAPELYHVPVILRAGTERGEASKKFILDGKQACVDLPGEIRWVVLNEHGNGFYRVNYSPKLLQALTGLLPDVMSTVERFNLVSDDWATTLAGHTALNEYLKLIRRFTEEKHKSVWSAITSSLSFLYQAIEPDARDRFALFVRSLAEPTYERLGFAPQRVESDLKRQLRGMIVAILGVLGNHDEIHKRAEAVYEKYKQSGPSAIDPDVFPAVVSILAHTGDPALYKEFFEQFKAARTPQAEQRFLFALAAFKDPRLIETTLKYTITGEVRTQDGPYLIQAMLRNVHARLQAWEFLTCHWDKLVELFPANSISRMCEGITSLIDSRLERQVIDFFDKHPIPQAGKTIDQQLERLRTAVRFKQREAEALKFAKL